MKKYLFAPLCALILTGASLFYGKEISSANCRDFPISGCISAIYDRGWPWAYLSVWEGGALSRNWGIDYLKFVYVFVLYLFLSLIFIFLFSETKKYLNK